MNNAQLSLAIGMPTLAVMVGILVNSFQFSSLSSRMSALEAKFDARFDMLLSKIVDIDNRLTRVEERLEHLR